MRRDICFYVEADVKAVYQAYLNAATHTPFERSCQQQPYHTISFGVNNSFKYNMNGGACTIHFMPQGRGTAVNMRFSIVQLMGARYERYAEDLNKAMQAFLPVVPRQISCDVEEFLKPQNQITPATAQPRSPAPQTYTPAPQPVVPSAPRPAPQSAPAPVYDPAPVYAPPAPKPAPAPAAPAAPKPVAAKAATDELTNIDLIRRYKSLMDDGVITEAEFAQKKKQLLGL